MGIISDKMSIGRGNDTLTFTLDVSGTMASTSLAGNANYMVIADASGVLYTQVAPAGTTGYLGFFGDGVDGDVTISDSSTLYHDMNYNNLTISNASLNTAGYIVRVKGTLTINSTGRIACNGNPGNSASATAGAEGGAAAFSDPKPEFGVPGNGGKGGTPGATGGTTTHLYSAASTTSYSELNPIGPYIFRTGSGGGGGGSLDNGTGTVAPIDASAIWMTANSTGAAGGTSSAGAGAGGRAGGGGGGGGGGTTCVYAFTIDNAGSIEANGGNAGNGYASGDWSGGGGGGGGGGVVIVYYKHTSGSGVGTLAATGGTAGSINGQAGNNGLTISILI